MVTYRRDLTISPVPCVLRGITKTWVGREAEKTALCFCLMVISNPKKGKD